jgi:hypothetical protein
MYALNWNLCLVLLCHGEAVNYLTENNRTPAGETGEKQKAYCHAEISVLSAGEIVY